MSETLFYVLSGIAISGMLLAFGRLLDRAYWIFGNPKDEEK